MEIGHFYLIRNCSFSGYTAYADYKARIFNDL